MILYKYNYFKRIADWLDFKRHEKFKYKNRHEEWTYERRFYGHPAWLLIGWQKRCRLCDKLFEEAIFGDHKPVGPTYNLK